MTATDGVTEIDAVIADGAMAGGIVAAGTKVSGVIPQPQNSIPPSSGVVRLSSQAV